MLQENKSLELLQKVTVENLYSKLIEQLNKDFQLSNLDEEIDISETPNQLKEHLAKILIKLLTHQYDDYLNLLYRVDVPEKELLTVKGNVLEESAHQIAYLILKREYQKVWFKNKF